MITEIEKEFYNTFSIPSSKLYTESYPCLDWCNKEPSACHGCTHHKGIDVVKDIYPRITSDIVLGLEEIVFNRTKNIRYGFNDGWYYCTNEEIKETSNSACRITGYGKTRKDALINLCTYLDIKDQVRALFNEL